MPERLYCLILFEKPNAYVIPHVQYKGCLDF